MIYTEKTKRAINLMWEAHRSQKDKAGIPYVFHPWTVAEAMDDEDSICAALLHDVAEDTSITLDEIRAMGFSSATMDALELLTHDDDTPYEDYIERLMGNDIARKVKLADLRHNMDLGRLGEITLHDIQRIDKYKAAYARLMSCEQGTR